MFLVLADDREVRPATTQDAFELELRDIDKREIEACTPLEHNFMVEISRLQSDWCMSFLSKGKPIAVFGVAPHTKQGWGVPWLLGSADIEDNFMTFGRWSKPFLNRMFEKYGVLQNFVHAENKIAIDWLQWLGFNFHGPYLMGRHGEPFFEFVQMRDS